MIAFFPRRLIVIATGVMLALGIVTCASASSVIEVTTDKIMQKSELVFEGTVIKLEPKMTGPKRIHTYVTFFITDIIKGSYSNDTITLRFLGGTVGDATLDISDSKIPAAGEHGIYCVESLARNQINPFYGASQGHFIIGHDRSGTSRVMTNGKKTVKSVKAGKSNTQNAQNREGSIVLSKGAASDIEIDADNILENGVTLDEFKSILRQKMDRK